MIKLLIFILTILFFFSCGGIQEKNVKTNFSKNQIVSEKNTDLTEEKKVFIEECNNYLIKNTNYNFQLLNYLCNERCGFSCFKLYEQKKDENLLNKALNLMEEECKNNIKNSCLLLGLYFYNKNDIKRAKDYFVKSCNLNDGEACYKVYLLEKNGNSLNYLNKACKLGNIKACFNLGAFYYKNGELAKAEKFLEKSCEKGNIKACFLLSKIYLKDKRDINKAINYLDKSCKLNSNNACLYIGYMYYAGKNVKKDKNKALEYFKYACDKLNSPKGCSLTGIILYSKNDYINSISYLNKGCNLKDGAGCLSLSLLLIKGEIFNKNPRLAMKYLKKAKKYGVDRNILNYLCKSGLKEACKGKNK